MAASNNPQSVKIARKRGAPEEDLPSTLIVQSEDGEASDGPVIYVRQGSAPKRRDISIRNLGDADGGNGDVAFAPQTGPKNELARRLFELKVKRIGEVRATGKRGRGDVATFVEKKKEKSSRSSSPGRRKEEEQMVSQYAAPLERQFKRPSRQPRARKAEGEDAVSKPQTDAERREVESLAQYLHEATLEEIKRERDAMTAKVTPPKISGQRAKELHRQRMESNRKLADKSKRSSEDTDVDMSDGRGDYIYDTYILATSSTAPSSSTSTAFDFASLPSHASDIGYLVIAPEDQDTWEAYIDTLPTNSSDEEQNSDDEDENAEDYYGADYPDDELSEDDEFGRKVYGYRRGGEESEGEGYESDDVAWGDDGEGANGDREVERMMNPFRVRGVGAGGVGREGERY